MGDKERLDQITASLPATHWSALVHAVVDAVLEGDAVTIEPGTHTVTITRHPPGAPTTTERTP